MLPLLERQSYLFYIWSDAINHSYDLFRDVSLRSPILNPIFISLKGIVHPKFLIYSSLQAIQDVDEFLHQNRFGEMYHTSLAH